MATLPAPLVAQADRWACRAARLAGFNCARYDNGTVTMTSELKGADFRQTLQVTGSETITWVLRRP